MSGLGTLDAPESSASPGRAQDAPLWGLGEPLTPENWREVLKNLSRYIIAGIPGSPSHRPREQAKLVGGRAVWAPWVGCVLTPARAPACGAGRLPGTPGTSVPASVSLSAPVCRMGSFHSLACLRLHQSGIHPSAAAVAPGHAPRLPNTLLRTGQPDPQSCLSGPGRPLPTDCHSEPGPWRKRPASCVVSATLL